MSQTLLLSILLNALIAGCIATGTNFALAQIAALVLKTPASFAPFTFLPVAAGCFGGAILAGGTYYILYFFSPHPELWFALVALATLLLSLHLPFRLTNHSSPRFAGATRPVQFTLCLMHFIAATTSVFSLILKPVR